MLANLRNKLKVCVSMDTTPEYWDCDCEYSYIHSHRETYCPLCGVDRDADEPPDSILDEVLSAGFPVSGYSYEESYGATMSRVTKGIKYSEPRGLRELCKAILSHQ